MAIRITLDPVAPRPVNRTQFLKDFRNSLQFDKVTYSDEQKRELKSKGFYAVTSSFISAVGAQDGDLYVRYHNGNVYTYANQGDKLEKMLGSGSRGMWMWRNVFRKGIRGITAGTLPLKSKGDKLIEIEDSGFDQDRLFEEHNELTTTKPIVDTPQVIKPVVSDIQVTKPKVFNPLDNVITLLLLQDLIAKKKEDEEEEEEDV